jgi:hypothetical protein
MLLLGGMAAFATTFGPMPGLPQAGPMPCGGHHSCCISPSPANVPAPPTTLNWHSSPAANSHEEFCLTRPVSRALLPYETVVLNLPSYAAFSTVLRI